MGRNTTPGKCEYASSIDFPHGFRLVLDPYLIHDARRALMKRIQVTIAQGLHLFPFRTEKLNLVAPMVLRKRESR